MQIKQGLRILLTPYRRDAYYQRPVNKWFLRGMSNPKELSDDES